MVTHGLALIAMAAFELRQRAPRRIDYLLVLSLSYIMWFVVVPFVAAP